MSRAVEGAQRRTVDLEFLTIGEVKLSLWIQGPGLVLVDLCGGREGEEIPDSADMVVVPMREDGALERRALLLQYSLQRLGPRWLALAGVDKYAPRTLADDVRVCPLKRKLP